MGRRYSSDRFWSIMGMLWLALVLLTCVELSPAPLSQEESAIQEAMQEFEAIERERVDSITALMGRWGFNREVSTAIWDAALAHGYEPDFTASLVAIESAGDSTAVSQAGAVGLIQVIPRTAKVLGRDPRRLTEARYNLDTGLTYLRDMQERFGSLGLALKAYNAGPTWAAWHAARGYKTEDMWYPRTVLEAM